LEPSSGEPVVAYLRRLVDGATSLRVRNLTAELHEFWFVCVGAVDALASVDLLDSADLQRWLGAFAELCERDSDAFSSAESESSVPNVSVAGSARGAPTASSSQLGHDIGRIIDATRSEPNLSELQAVATVGSSVERRSRNGVRIASLEFYADAVVVRWMMPRRPDWKGPRSGRDSLGALPAIELTDNTGTLYSSVSRNLAACLGDSIRGEDVYVPRPLEFSTLTISCEGTEWSFSSE
jgi:hypothetical protein